MADSNWPDAAMLYSRVYPASITLRERFGEAPATVAALRHALALGVPYPVISGLYPLTLAALINGARRYRLEEPWRAGLLGSTFLQARYTEYDLEALGEPDVTPPQNASMEAITPDLDRLTPWVAFSAGQTEPDDFDALIINDKQGRVLHDHLWLMEHLGYLDTGQRRAVALLGWDVLLRLTADRPDAADTLLIGSPAGVGLLTPAEFTACREAMLGRVVMPVKF